jgi:THO complex subunit 2 N-terminus
MDRLVQLLAADDKAGLSEVLSIVFEDTLIASPPQVLPEQLVKSLSTLFPVPQVLSILILEVFHLYDSDIIPADPGNPSRERLIHLFREMHSSNLFSSDLCWELLNTKFLEQVGLLASASWMDKRERITFTNLTYKQTKFNLLREEVRFFPLRVPFCLLISGFRMRDMLNF